MGFHVRVDDESKELIQLLQSEPSKIFGRLYSAYMLFLIGERDEEELKWLLDNAKALDSLTGTHVAYAVFAKEFKIKLRASASDRSPKTVGRISSNELGNGDKITRLVKNGRFGMVVDGDEITAITYGTDLVARQLGLLGQLPCIVVVDAIPRQSLCVLRLDRDVTSSLMAVLRKTTADFQRSTGDLTIYRDAERIRSIQSLIEKESAREAELRADIDRATKTINKLKEKIKTGQSNAEPAYLEDILWKRQNDRQEHLEELKRLPRVLRNRLAALDADLKSALADHRQHRKLLFSVVFERHVRALRLDSKLAAAQTSAFEYIGQLIKPDFLFKVWAAS